GKLGDDYILPHGAEHAYTAGELAGLTAEELRIARNEIYARHGRWFKSEDLNRYFRKKSWYEPSVEPDAFDSSVLNRNERDNLK
ncbi:YARHG domain-containing protein, partial [Eggerthella lenta]|uniref:YARHG domain-containing protein n=2 Tax=Bacillati TaxID=1783272 RepID=UPI001D061FEC